MVPSMPWRAQKELLEPVAYAVAPSQSEEEDAAEEDVYWLSALSRDQAAPAGQAFQPALPLVVLAPSPGGDAVEKDVEEGL